MASSAFTVENGEFNSLLSTQIINLSTKYKVSQYYACDASQVILIKTSLYFLKHLQNSWIAHYGFIVICDKIITIIMW